jgi:nucleotide-binding universal stress UspA family protein
MRIQRVLCPVDFSPYSRRALHHASALAAAYDATLHVLYVVSAIMPTEMSPLAPVPASLYDVIREERTSALQAFVATSNLTRPAVREVRDGSPSGEILAYAKDISADLIVLGSHGASGFERFVVGSTTARVLHHATCPVLTIPKGGDEPGAADAVRVTHVVAAVDFSPSSLRALTLGLDLARRDRARVTLVHVVETLTDEEARLVAHFRVGEFVETRRREALQRLQAVDLGPTRDVCAVTERVKIGNAARTILRVADEAGADLLVMGAQGRGAIGAALFGSATRTVVTHATCPVLTVRG